MREGKGEEKERERLHTVLIVPRRPTQLTPKQDTVDGALCGCTGKLALIGLCLRVIGLVLCSISIPGPARSALLTPLDAGTWGRSDSGR